MKDKCAAKAPRFTQNSLIRTTNTHRIAEPTVVNAEAAHANCSYQQ